MSDQNVGKIVSVVGPVCDVEFEPGQLPTIMNALFVSNPNAESRGARLGTQPGWIVNRQQHYSHRYSH